MPYAPKTMIAVDRQAQVVDRGMSSASRMPKNVAGSMLRPLEPPSQLDRQIQDQEVEQELRGNRGQRQVKALDAHRRQTEDEPEHGRCDAPQRES
jgi:hypothetical protein